MDETKTNVTVTGDVYRAAFECRALNDARYYLKGMFLSKANELVATNGHIMYYGPVDVHTVEPVEIIFEPVKIVANIVTVHIKKADALDHVVLETVAKNGTTALHMCKIIAGTYPDYRSVVKTKRKEIPFSMFGFNSTYMAKLPQIFGKECSLKFDMPNANGAAHVTSVKGGKKLPGTLVMMPTRVV